MYCWNCDYKDLWALPNWICWVEAGNQYYNTKIWLDQNKNFNNVGTWTTIHLAFPVINNKKLLLRNKVTNYFPENAGHLANDSFFSPVK